MCKRAVIMTVALAALFLGSLMSDRALAGSSAAGVSSKYTATVLANQRQVQNQGQGQVAKSEITSLSSPSAKSYAKR